MLFSYKILTFSQLLNKFHNKKFQYIYLKQKKKSKQNQTKIKTKHLLNSKTWSNREREEERVIDN